MQQKNHWETVYSSKSTDSVSWYQERAGRSLRLVHETVLPVSASIIDVGGGASTLVDDLLCEGYSSVTVLDLSAAALSAARTRLGERAESVTWIEANITDVTLPAGAYDVWHDRAVFHFLTTTEERRAYIATLMRALKPDGHVIMATFADDGPIQCSGLPVMRYSPSALHAEFGSAFTLLKQEREEHHTPSGAVQKFIYCYFRRV
jgi:2-polyprenyl-3-methyl-5-hydroxy-6-metoxy-1,4-benzoquinol methylase